AGLVGALRPPAFPGPGGEQRRRQLQVPGTGLPRRRTDPRVAPRGKRPAFPLLRRAADVFERQNPLHQMSFSPCAVVPCYNHGAAVGGVVAQLRALGLPVIVVDDGSDADTARVLAALT